MKNSKILNQEKTNLKERNKMKNLKKLVSSVLVVTLLAGSAASLSCSAFWPFSSSKANSSSTQETPLSSTNAQNSSSTMDPSEKSSSDAKEEQVTVTTDDKKEDNSLNLKVDLVTTTPTKPPLAGERILKMNPYLKREIDELYNQPCNEDPAYNCDKALTALKGLEKAMLRSRMYSDTQKQQIKEDIELLRQVVNFRKAKLKGSLTDKMKKEFREIENTLQNAIFSLTSLAAKVALVGGICYGVGYLIGFNNITTFLSNVPEWTTKTLLSSLCTVLKGIGLGSWMALKSCYSYFFPAPSM